MGLHLRFAGQSFDLAFRRDPGDRARIWINGKGFDAVLEPVKDGLYRLRLDGAEHPVWIAQHGETAFVHASGRTWEVTLPDPVSSTTGSGGDQADVIVAPMPGTVVDIRVKPGDPVSMGQSLLIIESMKMQTDMLAARDGVVAQVPVEQGRTFDRGAVLVHLEPRGK